MSSQTFADFAPINDPDDLVDWMRLGGRPRDLWAVGTEHEKIGYSSTAAAYPTYEGDAGIGVLLEALAAKAGWVASREGNDIVALSRSGTTITLEPGGQLELSGAPLLTLAEQVTELDTHFEELRRFSEPLGLTWSGMGHAPFGTAAQAPQMPKSRYRIMRAYLPPRGRLAMNMMHQTCTVQANLDFDTEADASRKFRVALMVQPLVIALWAASTVIEGRIVPQRSFRSTVWNEVDNARCKLPDTLLGPNPSLHDYVQWALDVPMFFIHREGDYVPVNGLVFRRFLDVGFGDHRATVGDFALHLSTLFPDVRLKPHLEVRGADMGDRAHVLALPALHAGLLYDDLALAEASRLFADVTPADWRAVRLDVETQGLDASLRGQKLSGWWAALLPSIREGLRRLEPGSEDLLGVLVDDLARLECPADRHRLSFNGDPLALLIQNRVC